MPKIDLTADEIRTLMYALRNADYSHDGAMKAKDVLDASRLHGRLSLVLEAVVREEAE